ncbi:hypothetical protein ASPVEDRAFT_473898 [Aspergillus versicolor CBS 583.65]|uniref:Uncharacterized protein n=1 Tax=Aspergillus versicolor CBS 583.65 TaxID=1036611 RepID=A0A1L9PAV2_ASPVE|nr:uncharacterized protein ASPVEDRAFT_473898 [Aspergillus versicolor CBS 583.65]OJI98585.1 hypothetical protein ASPVEDRAFT_473898 [Aspergillus versicolor CBS 583.65]
MILRVQLRQGIKTIRYKPVRKSRDGRALAGNTYLNEAFRCGNSISPPCTGSNFARIGVLFTMSAVTPATGALLAKTLTSPAALGFVPVAAQFHIFEILASINKPAAGEDVLAAYKSTLGNGDATDPVPCKVCSTRRDET